MSQQHIALITHSAYSLEPRCRRMAEALVAHGYAVDVFCVRWPGEPTISRLNGVRIFQMPVTRRQGRGRLTYITEYLRSFLLAAGRVLVHHLRERYALAQVFNPPDILAFSSLLPRLFSRARVIMDVRDMAPELFMSRFGLGADHRITRTLRTHERWACRYADAVTVCSSHQLGVMAGRGIPRDKMTVILNTPDHAIFGAPPPVTRPRPVAGRPFTLLFHGSLLERYGVGTLIEAAALLAPELPNLRVAFYGSGDFKPTAQELVKRLDVGETVHFYERLPFEAMPALIASADIGIVPTRRDVFTETTIATRLFEYVHMGIPTVVSRLSATADYFADDMVAYFAPDDPADLARQVLRLYHDPDVGQALAKNARRFTVQHNWAADQATYLALVDRLLR